MSPATLDPTPALVLIDLQVGIVAVPTAHPADEVVARAAALAAAFREHGLATVLVNVAMTDASAAAHDHSVEARLPDARPASHGRRAPPAAEQPGGLRVPRDD